MNQIEVEKKESKKFVRFVNLEQDNSRLEDESMEFDFSEIEKELLTVEQKRQNKNISKLINLIF